MNRSQLSAAYNLGNILITVWFLIQFGEPHSQAGMLKIFGWVILMATGWLVFICCLEFIRALWVTFWEGSTDS